MVKELRVRVRLKVFQKIILRINLYPAYFIGSQSTKLFLLKVNIDEQRLILAHLFGEG